MKLTALKVATIAAVGLGASFCIYKIIERVSRELHDLMIDLMESGMIEDEELGLGAD